MFLLTAAVAAQGSVQAELRALTPVGVRAVSGSRSDFKVIAANTLIARDRSVVQTAYVDQTFATMKIDWFNSTSEVGMYLYESGQASVGTTTGEAHCGSTASPSATNHRPGGYSFLLLLSGSAGARGLLDLSGSGYKSGSGQARYWVDVGNDGSVEYSFSAPTENYDSLKVAFDASGKLAIKIRVYESASRFRGRDGNYQSSLVLRFTLAPLAALRHYGTDCGSEIGGGFRKQSGRWHLNLMVRATPNSPGILAVGDREIRVLLPGMDCLLQTNVLVTFPFTANGFGQASLNSSWLNIPDIDLRLQAVDLTAAKMSRAARLIGMR